MSCKALATCLSAASEYQGMVTSRLREGIFPLCSRDPPGLLHPALGLPTQEARRPFEAVPEQGPKDDAEQHGYGDS